MNLYVIGENSEGNLEACSTAIKSNLKTWLNSVRMVNDSLDIFDATIVNIGLEIDIICHPDVNKNAVFNEAKEMLFEKLNLIKPEIGESFNVMEVFKILKNIDEILDVSSVKVVSKRSSSYSSNGFDVEANMSQNARQVYVPKESIWELKFKNDIIGTVR